MYILIACPLSPCASTGRAPTVGALPVSALVLRDFCMELIRSIWKY